MSHSRSARVSRLLLSFALVAAVAACGSGDSSSNRNRNVAIENEDGEDEEIDCDAQWDPTTGVMTLCQNFERVDVRQKGSNESNVSSSEGNTMTGNSLGITVGQGVTELSLKLWTRNEGGELREAGKVEFEANTAATKTFSFKPDAQDEVDRELVLGYENHEVTQTVAITGLTRNSKAKFAVEYRLNGEAAEQNVLHAEMRALDAGGSQVGSASADIDPTRDTEDQSREWTTLNVELKGGFMASTASLVFVISGRDGASTSGGQTGPRIKSATVKVGGNEISQNSEFEDGTDQWTVTDGSFAVCSETDGALPCITNAPFDKAFAAAVTTDSTVAPDTTLAADTTIAPDTTIAADTTIAPDTTLAADTTIAPDTTIAADTTLAPDTSATTQSTIAPALLVPRVECSMRWDPATLTFTACDDFAAIKVAAYGEDGRYVATVSGSDTDSVTVPQATAQQMKYAYFSLGAKLDTADSGTLIVSRAREWLATTNDAAPSTNNFLLDSVEQPTLRNDGYYESFNLNSRTNEAGTGIKWYADKNSPFENTLVVEVNGISAADMVTVPVAKNYTYRIFANNEFGFLDYVGGGIADEAEASVTVDIQVGDSGGLGLIKVNVETVDTGYVQPEDFDGIDPGECAGSQPILYTNPNSPAASNRITITLDSDCTSVNGIIAVAVVRIDDFRDGKDFDESVAWWNVSSTRYSSRMSETIYLPDGHYSIVYFNPDTFFLKGIDYTVDTGKRGDACKETALRIDQQSNLAVVEGCNVLTSLSVFANPLSPGQSNSADPEQRIEPDVKTSGAAIELNTVPSGWWEITVLDHQQNVLGGIFALCVESCDVNPSAGISVNSSNLSTTGKASVTDTACTALEGNSETIDIGFRDEGLTAYVQTDADHAPRAAWSDWNYLEDGDNLTGSFEAQFSRPGSRVLITTYCDVDGDVKNPEGDEDSSISFESRGMAVIDAPNIPTITPENDDFKDATDVSGAAEVTLNQVGGTLESNEPLAGLNAFIFDRSLMSSTWLKFTASDTTRLRLSLPQIDDLGLGGFAIGMTVYRKSADGQLGFVTTNMSLANLAFVEFLTDMADAPEAFAEAMAQEFFVQKDATYYVQLVGINVVKAPTTLLISNVDKGKWDSQELKDFMSSTTDGGQPTDSSVPGTPASDSTTPGSSAPDTTAPASRDTTPATDSTVASTTSVNAPDTTVAKASPDTTAVNRAPDTTAVAGSTSTSTAPANSTDTRMADGMLDLIRNGSQNETVPVLAGDGTPSVEIRQDASSVTLNMSDLVASVSKSGADIDPQSRVTITLKSGRHVAVSQKLRRVTVPTLNVFKGNSIKVSAYDTSGKAHSSEIKINKSLKPLVKVKGSDNNGRTPLYATVALLLLALILLAITRYFRKSGTAA